MKKEQVEKAANELIAESGIINLTREALCARADIPDGSFMHVMGCTFNEFVKSLASDTKLHTVSKKRLSKDDRKDYLLRKAVEYAKDHGYTSITGVVLAKHADISPSLVTHYFGTMKQLKRAVMRAAIVQEVPEIIAQGLSMGDPNAKKAPVELKALAATLLVNM